LVKASLAILLALSLMIAPVMVLLWQPEGAVPEVGVPDTPITPEGGVPARAGMDLSGLGAYFTENLGQLGPGAGSLYCEGDPLSVALGRGWMALLLHGPGGRGGALVRVTFEGARPVEPVGIGPTGGLSSYLIGDDPSLWVDGARHFSGARYPGLYDGIDLVFRLTDQQLKYEFDLAPGADPSRIAMTFEGTEALSLAEGSGALIIETCAGDVTDAAPVSFQETACGRIPVVTCYRLDGATKVAFSVGGYDRALPLVIDPEVIFATYVGGPQQENGSMWGNSFVDVDGCVHIYGYNRGGEFPTTPGALLSDANDDMNVFLAKLNASGDKILYASYIGGSGTEEPSSIYVGNYGVVYITGSTSSPDLPKPTNPIHPAYDSTLNGESDIFVMKINVSGSGTYLYYTNYIGGPKYEQGSCIFVDEDGCAYVAGRAGHSGFPTTSGAYASTPKGEYDVVVFKLSTLGDRLLYSTYFGGSKSEFCFGIRVDSEGRAVITGDTTSTDLPTTPSALQTTYGGGAYDAFVARLSADGGSLSYSTYIGGKQYDAAYALTLDRNGLIYLTGWTDSPDFPTTVGAYDRGQHGDLDAFVLRLYADDSELYFSTLIGGAGQDQGRGIWLDKTANVYVCGFTDSRDFPTTPTALYSARDDHRNGFLSRFDMNGTRLTFSTFVRGAQHCNDIFVDREGHVYLAGAANDNLETTVGAADTTSGGLDMFAMKLELGAPAVETLNLTGGPRLYAGYEAYDFTVDINPARGPQMATGALLTLDPGQTNVSLRWDPTRSAGTFYEGSDPMDVVTLLSTQGDVRLDEPNGTCLLHFRVIFGWSWPHEDSCDVLVSLRYLAGEAEDQLFEDVFSVENDLTLIGNVSAMGEWQGPVTEGAWVRAGENLTISGPIVVYEGTTDKYPPAGCCNVTLRDDEGDSASAPCLSGQPAEMSIQADPVTDLSEVLLLGLGGLPGTAESRTNLSLALRVDGELPTFENPVPEPEDWHGSPDVMVSITINDTATSGVDASSIDYSCSEGSGAYSAWSGLFVNVTGDGPVADGLATVTLPDGADNFIRWRAKDLVGNGWAVSDPFRIKVDTRNVTFRDPVPDPDHWFTTFQVLCGVTIDDLEGAGIDVSTVQWRTSPMNLSHYGPWNDWDEDIMQDNETVAIRATLDLAESGRNYLQWRAMDIAGNGFTTSPHYRVRTDVTPVEFSGFEPGEGRPQNRTDVTCSATVLDKAGGSGVNLPSIEYRWGYEGAVGTEWSDWTSAGMEGATMSTWFSFILQFRHGPGNLVQLRGCDVAGNGPTPSPVFTVVVDTAMPEFVAVRPGPSDKQVDPDVLVTLTLRDDFTGVDCSRVEYRTGQEPNHLGEWSPMAVVPQTLGNYSGSVRILFAPGRNNYFQFRAVDLAGNAATSAISSVWVNRPPVAVIASPDEDDALLEGETVWLSANGSMDPDENGLTYSWLIDGTAVPGATTGWANVTLAEGYHNVTLVLEDDVGARGTANVLVYVGRLAPPHSKEEEGTVNLVILLVIVVALILLAAFLRLRRRQGIESS
jgi:hypothetical protein